jgi:hypothetical protein
MVGEQYRKYSEVQSKVNEYMESVRSNSRERRHGIRE